MKATEILTLADLPSLPAAIKSQVATVEGTSELLHQLETEGAPAGRLKSFWTRKVQALRHLLGNLELRGKAQRAQNVIDQERAAALADVKQCEGALKKAVATKEGAQARIAETQQRIAKLGIPEDQVLADHEMRVMVARKAFSEAMDGGSDAALMQAAKELHAAIEGQADAARKSSAGRAPADLVLGALRKAELEQSGALVPLMDAIADATEDLCDARARLAMVEYDSAANAAVCAYVRAAQSIRECPRPRYPFGFDQAAFFISSGRRSIVRSNILSGMGDNGPVILGALALSQLCSAATTPDLEVFIEDLATNEQE